MIGLGAVLAAAAGMAWGLWPAKTLDAATFRAAYATPLPPPDRPVAVYHLGHSLVGRDMPAMLAAAAGHAPGQGWAAQLGWGASLKTHMDGAVPGFAEENAHPAFRPAAEALAGTDYPVIVLTEMVELKDAIRYHDSARTLGDWVVKIRRANPEARIYLYETWHRTGDPAGWLNRIEADRALWEGLLRQAMAREGSGTVYVIPGGQVMAAVTRAAEAGQIPGVSGQGDLISDDIHFTDLGAWVMAMTHHAVIYGRSPVGLAAQLPKSDGQMAGAPSDEAAQAIQQVVWGVVTSYPLTGVPQG